MSRSSMRRGLFAVFAAFILSTLVSTDGSRTLFASSSPKKLAVMFTSDTNGYLEPCG